MTPVSALCGGTRRLLLQMPLPSAICPLTWAAGGSRSREQREAERAEDDGATLRPNPALADQNLRVTREGFRFIWWAKKISVLTCGDVRMLSVLHCLDKSVLVSQIYQTVFFHMDSVKQSRGKWEPQLHMRTAWQLYIWKHFSPPARKTVRKKRGERQAESSISHCQSGADQHRRPARTVCQCSVPFRSGVK